MKEKEYRVRIPIAGSVTVYVYATSEEEALTQGWIHIGDGDSDVVWEAFSKLVDGNVLNAPYNEIEVFCDG